MLHLCSSRKCLPDPTAGTKNMYVSRKLAWQQNSQYLFSHSPHDYRTTQAGMCHQSPPFMGPFASNMLTDADHHSQYYQGPLSHPPPVAHSAYPPLYQQLPSYPSVPHPPATSSHHITAKNRDLTSNLFSLSITARFDLATEGVVNALDQLGTFWPHAFVLYTHADDMGSTESEQKQQIYQWINNPRCPERLKWLLQQVQQGCSRWSGRSGHGRTGF